MTTLQDLKAEHEALGRKIAAFEQAKTGGVWVPKIGNAYWSYDIDGETVEHAWNDYHYERARLSIGNVFPTKEAAETHVKKLKVIQRLKVLAGGFCPDWNGVHQHKWYPVYDHGSNDWKSEYSVYLIYSPLPHFPTKPLLSAAIKELGPDMDVLKEGI